MNKTKKIFCFVSALFLSIAPIVSSQAYDIQEGPVEEIHLLKGELESVYVQDLTRLAVANPDVVDVNDATSDEIVIVGKDIGQTAIFIWDVGGKRTVMVYVHNQDLNIVKKRLEELFKEAGIYEIDITLNEKEGSVVLSGFLPKEKRMAYELIIGKFSSEILDLVKDEQNDDLIQIDLQITELNETLLKGLGVEWFSAGQEDSVSISGGGFGGTNNPIYAETPPETDGSIKDFFKIGQFNRTSTFVAQINAYLTEGKARLLSAPKLVTVSGEEASFLVGGEIPITTTTVNENGAAENVEYKEFGVGMTIIPTIRKNKIDIQLNMEVSDIDPTNSQGGDVAFTTRTAQTRLYLDDGQTIIIAGLIRQTDSEEVRKVPFLADIPVLGALFRTRGTPVLNEDKELVVSLTPHRLTNNQKEEVARAQQIKAETAAKSGEVSTAKPYYSGIPREMTDYIQGVQARISQAIQYPMAARDYGWEGTVKVGMLILDDGTLAYAMVKESSGYEIFDEVAVETAKKMAPFASFPPNANLQELNVTIPIVYSLNTP